MPNLEPLQVTIVSDFAIAQARHLVYTTPTSNTNYIACPKIILLISQTCTSAMARARY